MGRVSFAVVVVLAAALSAGCSQAGGGGVACPAIAYLKNLTVNLEGDASKVSEIQGCVDGVCSRPLGPPMEDVPPESVPPPEPFDPSATPSAQESTSPPPSSPYSATKVEMDRWVINFDMAAPPEVTVRALGGDGEVLVERDYALQWERVGGSEECGGPMETDPVTLVLP